MCGIAGYTCLSRGRGAAQSGALSTMSKLLAHRGPDGQGAWRSSNDRVGLCHERLAILDSTPTARQPMMSPAGFVITYNGEIYNYRELRETAHQKGYQFRSSSDTEAILATYEQHGLKAIQQLRGMFAFGLWDESRKQLVLARDRFGIKPLYYCIVGQDFYFASEIKALLPFLPSIATNTEALAEYLTFQYTISGQTMFDGVKEVPPGHYVIVLDGTVTTTKYWDVSYEIEYGKSAEYFETRLRELLNDSVAMHLRSDVEVGSYLSGGIDSSLIYGLASEQSGYGLKAFHGRFLSFEGFDESNYARDVAASKMGSLDVLDISAQDFVNNISKVIYHLDQPTAGPGAFPQFMVSAMASKKVKAVLGGQGADEIFGGYTRYLLAYFEQCIKAAMDGSYKKGNYVVTIESIIPNLGVLRNYKPLIQEFWKDGLFGPLDQRFLRLIDRSTDMKEEVDWTQFNMPSVHKRFYEIFNNSNNVAKESYFDRMTHFEFKTLLPALLHVEDRMSMAHGLESRVPFLDHPLVEFAATVPADIKFKDGKLKHLLRSTFSNQVPASVMSRQDKMGFPVPINVWLTNSYRSFFFWQKISARRIFGRHHFRSAL
ncbi:MAG: asparagine synthase (glutamine-hydrolyzing) [Actinobacteria bacterium]|nr:asparagine synthase (glutamine-hydrolyzing) [Actinomycetota bacterium]